MRPPKVVSLLEYAYTHPLQIPSEEAPTPPRPTPARDNTIRGGSKISTFTEMPIGEGVLNGLITPPPPPPLDSPYCTNCLGSRGKNIDKDIIAYPFPFGFANRASRKTLAFHLRSGH